MPRKDLTGNVKTAINLITVSAYDGLIHDLGKLKLDHESYESVLALIEQKKEESVFDVKGKKKLTDKRVGRSVPAEKQCKHEANGKRCGSFMSDKSVRLCWVHMTTKQRERHKKNKNEQLD